MLCLNLQCPLVQVVKHSLYSENFFPLFCKYNKKKTSKYLEVIFFNLKPIQRTDFRIFAQPGRQKQTEESFAGWQHLAASAGGFQALSFLNLNQFSLVKWRDFA